MAVGALAIDDRAPEVVRALVDVIGADGYARLEQRLGGAQVYVPRSPGPDHPLTHAVGPELAGLIGEHFCGEKLLLPVGHWRRPHSKRREILTLAETMNGDEIAARLKVARSWVYEVLAEARRRNDDQGGLF